MTQRLDSPSSSNDSLTVGAVLLSALAWAFWAYPVRAIENWGVTGVWTGVVMSAAALIICLPLLLFSRGKLSSRALIGALLAGAAVMMYTISVSFTDFIRAVIIFYIAPAWSLIIECVFLGRKWTLRALISILCALAGLLLISRGEVSFEGVGAIGDWMALLAGIAWSAGAALIFTARETNLGSTIIGTLLGSIAIGALWLYVLGDAAGAPPGPQIWQSGALRDCLLGGLYLAFILGCTMWGAMRLAPAVLSFLLSIEIIAGIAVGAILLGERFGYQEAAGSICVIGAVILELTRPKTSKI